MKHESGNFDSPEELRAILSKFAKEHGLEDPGPCTGYVDVTYSIGPYVQHGGFGTFVGESIQEKLDEFIEGVFETWRRFYMVLADENYPIKDEPTLNLHKDIVDNYSQKDVKLIDWKFTREE